MSGWMDLWLTIENVGNVDLVVWFRIWGVNCENVGSSVRTCPPESPSLPACEALATMPCAEFYYGAPNCSVFCRSTDSCLGHYTCGRDGSRVCLPGWTEPNCTVNVATKSSECTCRDGGTWLDGVCVGEVSTTEAPVAAVTTTQADAGTPSTTTQSVIFRLIAMIKTLFPILSPGEQLQLLAATLQQLQRDGAAAFARELTCSCHVMGYDCLPRQTTTDHNRNPNLIIIETHVVSGALLYTL